MNLNATTRQQGKIKKKKIKKKLKKIKNKK
jgi:hypothetical protein